MKGCSGSSGSLEAFGDSVQPSLMQFARLRKSRLVA